MGIASFFPQSVEMIDYLLNYAHVSSGFWINLPVGAVIAGLILLTFFPDNLSNKPPAMTILRSLHTKLDLLGFVLFAGCTIQLLLALQYGGNQYAWNSSTTIGLFCGSGVAFSLWLAWDWYKGDAAMMPLSIVCKRPVGQVV